MRDLKTESDCRLIYTEIVNGYSYNPEYKLFIKHLTELEISEIERKRRELFEEAKKQKLIPEKEKLELLAINGHWNKQDEEEYQNYQEEIKSLRLSLNKLIIPQQKEHLEGIISQRIKENNHRWLTRSQLLHPTCEDYANRRTAEHQILFSFYKDPQLTKNHFSQEDVDNIQNKDLEIFIDIYYKANDVFTEKNFKRIAVCPFFLNAFLVSNENPYFLFGKPIVDLTIYQLALFSRGSYYKNILEESSQRPPEEFFEDLDKVILFYDKEYSIILGKRAGNKLI